MYAKLKRVEEERDAELAQKYRDRVSSRWGGGISACMRVVLYSVWNMQTWAKMI